MLDKNNERQLAYLTTVDAITPIKKADRLEAAHVGGWVVVVSKNEFKVGDPAIYLEIDSQVPIDKTPWCDMEFLVSKGGKIKTQKIRGQISQGLLVPVTAFGWTICKNTVIKDDKGKYHHTDDESRFLTKQLGITYSSIEDRKRKGAAPDKYKKMAQRHPELGKKWWWKKLYKSNLGKKILFVFFGKKKDDRNWPEWVSKTDEERVQNEPWILSSQDTWIATEKIDGSSSTFTMRRVKNGLRTRYEYYVCSRNVNFDTPEKQDRCFYPTNIYIEMSNKYHMEDVLRRFLDNHPDCEWVTIQGETFGDGVQRRNYSRKDHDFRAFNLIDSISGRWNSISAANYLAKDGIPWVPILETLTLDKFHNSVDEILNYATGKSKLDGLPREGIVFRNMDGIGSFKAVSNEYLLKYHQ